MGKELKIVLPVYKVTYALFFTVILSIVRGVVYTYEIGIALEAPMAILAIVFCADTYVQEIMSKRSEIHRLYPIKKRVHSTMKRMALQEACMLFLAVLGYGLFFIFQNPFTRHETQTSVEGEMIQFFLYLAAILVTVCFWGLLSNTLSCLLRNMWGGMGCCLVLWILTNSSSGERYLGSWNLFSYVFRNTDVVNDLNWMKGKILCIGLCLLMVLMLPKILKKRG